MSSPHDVFEKVMQLDKLVTLIVTETNRYAQQNRRNSLRINAAEMKAFLGMNYIMGVNKLPTIHDYWESDDYVGNEGIRNVMTRELFKEIFQNIHFADNSKSNKESDKDEHMVKFKHRSSM